VQISFKFQMCECADMQMMGEWVRNVQISDVQIFLSETENCF